MAQDDLTEKIKELNDRLNGVFEQYQTNPDKPASIYDRVVADLQVTLEELQVASEELQQRDESLIAAQEIIEAERQRYYLLFDNSPDGYVVTDKYGRILEANQAAARMLGVEIIHLSGKPFTFYIEKAYKTKIFGRYIELGKLDPSTFFLVDEGEVLIRPRRIDPFWAHISMAAGPYDKANYPGEITVLWTIHDVSQLKQAHQELQEARDQLEIRVNERTKELVEANQALKATLVELERRNKELQEFAFAASHDLQEPLRKISKFGELVMAHLDDDMDNESADYVRRMVNASQRMESMISGLLEYSRVSSQDQHFSQVDLNAVAREVVSDLDIARSKVKGQIKVEPLPAISANPVQMRQLLQNLIANGLKFHRDAVPPQVEVWCELQPDGYPEREPVEHIEDAEWIELHVKDNGIGFEEHYLERMLQPFERLHGSGEYEGMGMGLAICRKIVERHGGKITAHSTTGKGSTFIVTLPVRQEQV